MRRYLQITLLTALLLGQSVPAQSNKGKPSDIYDRIAQLADSLQNWRLDPPSIERQSSFNPLQFNTVFQGYDITIDTSNTGIQIIQARLPLYLGILTTQVKYQIPLAQESRGVQFINNLEYRNGLLYYDDSSAVDIDSVSANITGILNEISKKMYLYRTLGLPTCYQPDSLDDGDLSVTLLLHGRDIIPVQYPCYANWITTLRKMAHHMLVYAGPVKITKDNNSVSIQFYTLLTRKDGLRHYFFLINEKYQIKGNESEPVQLVADLYPFIRLDNLRSLYSPPMRSQRRERIPIHINR